MIEMFEGRHIPFLILQRDNVYQNIHDIQFNSIAYAHQGSADAIAYNHQSLVFSIAYAHQTSFFLQLPIIIRL